MERHVPINTVCYTIRNSNLRGGAMRKLCIDVFEGLTDEELYPLAKEAGFDGFFSPPEVADNLNALKKLKQYAESLGLFQETVHCTLKSGSDCSSDLWFPGDAGDRFIDVLLRNVDHCAAIGVPILVVHPQTNFLPDPDISLGLSRFERLVEHAGKCGVHIAFENIDSADLLDAVMEHFPQENAGFCYDSGHEHWLTPDARWLRKYGDRLLCTHIHDNDGTFDKHLLPGDGTIDFEQFCEDLRACGYQGAVSIEVAYRGISLEKYSKEEFIKKSFEIAKQLAQRIDA